ncbi:MAG: cellulase family glycosylhydrolase [Kiritimatiellae bacterium]|jgi:aryl-phospho-beta-D-glucosidase BglC (GH1 family)|nr:cellulase family glycosylhydrolase [Kiritimatiellia bacterium]
MNKNLLFLLLISCLSLNTFAADVYKPEKRWRGFNLMGMFIKGSSMSSGHYSEQDFKMISELGFNFVRLPMDYRFWIKDDNWESINKDAFKPIDEAIAFGRKYNIHVMLNFHRAPGYTVAKPHEKLNVFKDVEALRVCIKHWGMIAERYKDIPAEDLSFNLFNEPIATPEEYEHVAADLIKEIYSYNPRRLIVCDGLKWGRNIVPELFKYNVGQATRGYTPSSISHYRASWAGNPTATPVWPISGAISPLYGPSKKEYSTPLVMEDVPACKMIIEPGRVSGNLTFEIKADDKVIATFALEPKKGEGWSNVDYKEQWKIYQADCDKTLEVLIPEEKSTISISIIKGDWAGIDQITLFGVDNQRAVLTFTYDWYKANPLITFRGFDTHSPFQTAGVKDGISYLRENVMAPWEKAASDGHFVMVGEFGAYKYTPHDIVLDWMEDYLKIWNNAQISWAMWNFRGSFGVLDSCREDVTYEDFQGHKLDRKMLDLLQRY